MKRFQTTAVLLGVCAMLLAGASTALAATPRQIYNDYATHGRLTHHYSKADLQRALQSTMLKGYSHGHGPGLKTQVTAKVQSPTTHGGLPFTGMDLGLITFGAVVLLMFGATLRRFARARS
jgi:hypothetical protein